MSSILPVEYLRLPACIRHDSMSLDLGGETSRNGILRTLRPQEGGPLFAQGSIATFRDSSVDVPDVVTSENDMCSHPSGEACWR
jgi:hypothetical protein